MEFASYATTTLLDSSRKMITSNSLFIDGATRDMMQQTGQTAVEAQSTQRALDRLGLSFEDLQSGKLTEAQAKAFEDVRNREISKLKRIRISRYGRIRCYSIRTDANHASTTGFTRHDGYCFS